MMLHTILRNDAVGGIEALRLGLAKALQLSITVIQIKFYWSHTNGKQMLLRV
jgi:hypothetical protein